MKNALTFILYKIVIGSLWEQQLVIKPAAFSLDHKPAAYCRYCKHARAFPAPGQRELLLARGRQTCQVLVVLVLAGRQIYRDGCRFMIERKCSRFIR